MSKLKIPERFTGRIYIGYYSNPNSPIYGMLTLSEYDHSESGEIIQAGHVDVDVPLDQTGSLDKQVAQLRKAKQKIIDEASAKAGQIDEAIESLLAIEHKGETND